MKWLCEFTEKFKKKFMRIVEFYQKAKAKKVSSTAKVNSLYYQ